ncbi:HAD family hydrolase [Almyronema epifaneia]|uniref:HAD family hydrolase n=1 Tax=Almyronema epifaneia S1 TaxID=2991925 RepID=A0ABW6IH47_9CYAN
MVTVECSGHQFHNIEAVLFDKDGTLANSEEFLRSLAQKRSRLIDAQVPGVQEPLLLAFGVDGDRLNPAGLMAVGNRQENETAAAAYIAETGKDWIESLEVARSAFVEADSYLLSKADYTPPFAGISNCLERLASAGLKLGILSADTTANIQAFVARYQFSEVFQLTLGSDRPDCKKPDPRFFQVACHQLGVRPQHALSIGDATSDLQMARQAKAAGFVGVRWGWSQPVRLTGADSLIDQPEQLQVSA